MNNFFKKDGIIYYFNSKFDFFNNPYGVSFDDIETINLHIERVKTFLSSIKVNVAKNKNFSFLDICKSANYSPDTFKAEIWNRVNTLKEYAKNKNFDTPLFLTITPPSHFKPLKQIKLKNNIVKMVDNPNFCGVYNYVDEARKYISDLWRKFLRQRIFKDIKNKYGENMIYLRTYEPFIDGTPHAHFLCFIPSEFKTRFITLFKKYFKETKHDIKSSFDENVGGVVAYLLKYVLKSFANSKDKKMDYVAYWYFKFKIRRFSLSRTLLPITLYRKISHDERFRNLLEMTQKYKNGDFSFEIIANIEKVINNQKLLSSDKKIVCILVSMPYYDDYFIDALAYEKSKKIIILFPNGKKIIVLDGLVASSDFTTQNVTINENITAIKIQINDNELLNFDDIKIGYSDEV